MLVANGFAWAVKDDVVPVAHARHQLDAQQPAQTENRFALALGVGVERVRLDRGTVLYQPVQNVDCLPDTARDEASKKRNVAVGDMGVGDTAISTITNVPGADEIVLPRRNMCAVGDCRPAGAPELRQGEAGI